MDRLQAAIFNSLHGVLPNGIQHGVYRVYGLGFRAVFSRDFAASGIVAEGEQPGLEERILSSRRRSLACDKEIKCPDRPSFRLPSSPGESRPGPSN